MNLITENNNEEVVLTGGYTTEGVVRIGNTVRRPIGPHSEFVHKLLIELELNNFNACPKFFGIDDKKREILSFIPGEVPHDLDYFSDDVIMKAAQLLKSFHNVTARTKLTNSHEVIIHDDFTPCNTVFINGMPTAMIDFDSAKPGTRVWDLSYSIWLWLDLGNIEINEIKQAERIHTFCKAYGYKPDDKLFDNIILRQKIEVQGQFEDAQNKGLNPLEHLPYIWTKNCLKYSNKHMHSIKNYVYNLNLY